MIAWLVTMVPTFPEEEVVTTFNYRLSSHTVGSALERIYVERREGLTGLLAYTKSGKAKCRWRHAEVDGVPWSEELYCGSGDRFLWARKVEDLRVVKLPDGRDRLAWQERKRPDLKPLRKTLGILD